MATVDDPLAVMDADWEANNRAADAFILRAREAQKKPLVRRPAERVLFDPQSKRASFAPPAATPLELMDQDHAQEAAQNKATPAEWHAQRLRQSFQQLQEAAKAQAIWQKAGEVDHAPVSYALGTGVRTPLLDEQAQPLPDWESRLPVKQADFATAADWSAYRDAALAHQYGALAVHTQGSNPAALAAAIPDNLRPAAMRAAAEIARREDPNGKRNYLVRGAMVFGRGILHAAEFLPDLAYSGKTRQAGRELEAAADRASPIAGGDSILNAPLKAAEMLGQVYGPAKFGKFANLGFAAQQTVEGYDYNKAQGKSGWTSALTGLAQGAATALFFHHYTQNIGKALEPEVQRGLAAYLENLAKVHFVQMGGSKLSNAELQALSDHVTGLTKNPQYGQVAMKVAEELFDPKNIAPMALVLSPQLITSKGAGYVFSRKEWKAAGGPEGTTEAQRTITPAAADSVAGIVQQLEQQAQQPPLPQPPTPGDENAQGSQNPVPPAGPQAPPAMGPSQAGPAPAEQGPPLPQEVSPFAKARPTQDETPPPPAAPDAQPAPAAGAPPAPQPVEAPPAVPPNAALERYKSEAKRIAQEAGYDTSPLDQVSDEQWKEWAGSFLPGQIGQEAELPSAAKPKTPLIAAKEETEAPQQDAPEASPPPQAAKTPLRSKQEPPPAVAPPAAAKAAPPKTPIRSKVQIVDTPWNEASDQQREAIDRSWEKHLKDLAGIEEEFGTEEVGKLPEHPLDARSRPRSEFVQANLKLLRDLPQRLAKNASEFGKAEESSEIERPELPSDAKAMDAAYAKWWDEAYGEAARRAGKLVQEADGWKIGQDVVAEGIGRSVKTGKIAGFQIDSDGNVTADLVDKEGVKTSADLIDLTDAQEEIERNRQDQEDDLLSLIENNERATAGKATVWIEPKGKGIGWLVKKSEDGFTITLGGDPRGGGFSRDEALKKARAEIGFALRGLEAEKAEQAAADQEDDLSQFPNAPKIGDTVSWDKHGANKAGPSRGKVTGHSVSGDTLFLKVAQETVDPATTRPTTLAAGNVYVHPQEAESTPPQAKPSLDDISEDDLANEYAGLLQAEPEAEEPAGKWEPVVIESIESKGAAADRYPEGTRVTHEKHGPGTSLGRYKDFLRVRYDNGDTMVVDARALSPLKKALPSKAGGPGGVRATFLGHKEAAQALAAHEAARPEAPQLPKDWTVPDIEQLLKLVNAGDKILVGDTELGIPTIHGIPNARHVGMGMFKASTPDYDIDWDGGGAMERTPSGKGFTRVSTKRGEFPYDRQAVIDRLESLLPQAQPAEPPLVKHPIGTAKPKAAAEQPPTTKPTLHEQAQGATAEFGDSLDDIGAYLRKKGLYSNPFADPELLALIAKATAKAVKAGVLNFADFVNTMARKFGDDLAVKLGPAMERLWQHTYDKYSPQGMSPAGSVHDIIAQRGAEGEKNEPSESAAGKPGAGSGTPAPRDAGVDDGPGQPGADAPPLSGRSPRKRPITEGAQQPGEPLPPDAAADQAAGAGDAGRHAAGDRPERTPDRREPGLAGGAAADQGGEEGPQGVSQEHEEAPNAARNHVIEPDDELATSSIPASLKRNLDALQLLKRLESEARNADPAEKRILAQYTGWGGLSQALDRIKGERMEEGDEGRQSWLRDKNWEKTWGKAYKTLKSLLTAEEWEKARDSTLNAHYTSRTVIEKMYDIVKRLGFRGGRLGEFGAGIGHFIGLMPPEFRERTQTVAVEADALSSRILKKLYPEAAVYDTLLEQFRIAPGSLDVMVGNIPFAQEGPVDAVKRYGQPLNLHNYFLARELDALHAGGLDVVISTHNTLDKEAAQRKLLAEKGDLIGAIRLPNNAFAANAKTKVVADILIFRKPLHGERMGEEFTATRPVDTLNDEGEHVEQQVNQYFIKHPEMVLGEHSSTGSQYGPDEYSVEPTPGDLGEKLAAAIERLPQSLFGDEKATGEILEQQPESGLREGELSLHPDSGKLQMAVSGKHLAVLPKVRLEGYPHNLFSKPGIERAADYITLRDAYREVRKVMRDPASSAEEIKAAQDKMGAAYDAYTAAHGKLHGNKTGIFQNDPEYYRVLSLEDEKAVLDTKFGKFLKYYKKADVFSTRTYGARRAPESVASSKDGMLVSMGYRGRIDPDYIAQLTGKTPEEVIQDLQAEGLIFRDPATQEWMHQNRYLSGNVRKKLREAETAAEEDPAYAANVAALQKIQPEPIPAEKITYHLGGHWIPDEIVQDWARKLFDTEVDVTYNPQLNHWRVSGRENNTVTGEWGVTWSGQHEEGEVPGTLTKSVNGYEILEDLLNLHGTKVTKKIPNGVDDRGRTKYETRLDEKRTAAAKGLARKMDDRFISASRQNPAHASRIANAYNERYNSYVDATYDGSHLVMPGASSDVNLRPYQKNAIWRILQDGYAMLAHAVGAGKTFTMIGAAMEQKRLGLAKRPLLVVHNATLGQFATSFLKMYPDANVLVMDKDDLGTDNRQLFLNRVTSGNWDAIVMAQSTFERLACRPEVQEQFIHDKLTELEDAIREEGGDRGRESPPSVKELVRARKALQARLEKLASSEEKNRALNRLYFEDLEADSLFLDEAHAYKKPPFVTKLENIVGLNKQVSGRGLSTMMKVRNIQALNNGRNVVLATGTPITNTLGEAWHMTSFVAPHVNEDFGINSFDGFASTFALRDTVRKMNAGGAWTFKDALVKFTNGAELQHYIRAAWDIFTPDQLKTYIKEGEKKGFPELRGGKIQAVTIPLTPGVEKFSKFLKQVYAKYLDLKPKDRRELSYLAAVSYGASRAAALDIRLIFPDAKEEAGSKIDVASKLMLDEYRRSTPNQGVQLIFSDLHSPYNISTLQAFMAGEMVSLDMPIAEEEEADFDEAQAPLYQSIKQKLIAGGVPEHEIAIVGEAKTDAKRAALWERARAGEVRFLIGSSEKMGVGVNVQEKVTAIMHLDSPQLPMYIEQREGRGLRYGNENPDVAVYRFAMEHTLDGAIFADTIRKSKFIWQVLGGQIKDREFDDPASESIMSFAQQLAAIDGNPLLFEQMDLDRQRKDLELEREAHGDQVARSKHYAQSAEDDAARLEQRTLPEQRQRQTALEALDMRAPNLELGGKRYEKQEDADKALKAAIKDWADQVVGRIKEGKLDHNRPAPSDAFEAKYKNYVSPPFKIAGLEGRVIAGAWQEMEEKEVEENGKTKIKHVPQWHRNEYVSLSLPGEKVNLYQGNATTVRGLWDAARRLVEENKGYIASNEARLADARKEAAELRAVAAKPWEGQDKIDAISRRLAEIEQELVAGKQAPAAEAGAEAAPAPPEEPPATRRGGLERRGVLGPDAADAAETPEGLPPSHREQAAAAWQRLAAHRKHLQEGRGVEGGEELLSGESGSIANPFNAETWQDLKEIIVNAAKYGYHTLAAALEDARKVPWWKPKYEPFFTQEWNAAHPSQKPAEEAAPAQRPESVSGIKDALVAELRAGRGAPELSHGDRQHWQEWLDQAAAKMQEPQAAGDKPLADQIIDRIQADPKKPISPAETAVLQIQYRQLNNLFEDACNKQETARQAGDAAAQEQAAYDVNRHHARLDEVEQAYELAGQAWGRAGAARRMELAKDMTPAGITRRWIAAQHGEALSKAQREEINKLAGAFQREEQAWGGYLKQEIERQVDARIEDAIQDDRARRKPPKAARPAPVEKPLAPEIQSMLGRLADWLKPKADEALARIRARHQHPRALDVTGVPGMIAEDLKDAAILGSYHIANGLLEIGKWKRAMLEAVGEWITPHLDAVWQESVASIGRPDKPAEIGFDEGAVQKIIDRPAVEKKPKTPLGRQPAKMPAYIPERENAEELFQYLRDIQRAVVDAGVGRDLPAGEEREAVVDAVWGEARKHFSDLTWDEARHILSGYGRSRPAPRGSTTKKIIDINRQLQILLGSEAIQRGEKPLSTGDRRLPASDEQRQLLEQRAELLKRPGLVDTRPGMSLKTAEDVAIASVQNRITDLQWEIDHGERIVQHRSERERGARETALRQQLAELKVEHDAIFKTPTDQAALRNAAIGRALDRAIESLEANNRAGNIGRPEKVAHVDTAENLAKRVQLLKLKAQREELRKLDPAFQASEEARRSASAQARLLAQLADAYERYAQPDAEFMAKRPIREPALLDQEGRERKQALEAVRQKSKQREMEIRRKNRYWWEKTLDLAGGWRVAGVLSHLSIVGKLTASAVTQLGTKFGEDVLVGGALRKTPLLGRVMERASQGGATEGIVDAGAHLRGAKAAIVDAATYAVDAATYAKDLAQAILTFQKPPLPPLRTKGGAALDTSFGRVRPPTGFVESLVRNAHGLLHDPVKVAGFNTDFAKRMASYAKTYGADYVADPINQLAIATESYKNAQKWIFFQDNALSLKMKEFFRPRLDPKTGHPTLGGKAWELAGKAVVPISTVPFNILGEALEHIGGIFTLPTHAARLGYRTWKEGSFQRAVESLTPEQADLVARHLKRGLAGAAFMALGYCNPASVGGFYSSFQPAKDEAEWGTVKIGELTVPRWMLHNPLFLALHFGATVRRIQDSYLRQKDAEPRGLPAAVLGGAVGVVENAPGVSEMLHVGELLRDPGTYLAKEGKSMAVPGIVQDLEKWFAAEQAKKPRKPSRHKPWNN